MGRQPLVPATRTAAAILVLAGLAGACSGGPTSVATHSPAATVRASASPQASASPSPSPSASSQPVNGAFGVLVTTQGASTYTVSLVATDGKVVASAKASTPPPVTCANAAAAVVPLPVSTSDTDVYFMDADGNLQGLSPTLGPAAMPLDKVPAPTATRRSMFAVRPDNHRVAVVVADFTASGANTSLYVEDPGGGNRVDIFSEVGAYTLWPIGWHGANNLVVAKVPACTQGGGPFCCGPQELHVVDPATANRRFTLGSSDCVIAGAASPAGVVCMVRPDFVTMRSVNWTGGVMTTYQTQGGFAAYLSPDGNAIAVVNAGITHIFVAGQLNMEACGWIDQWHVIAGGDAQHQPRVGDVRNDQVVPVATQGDCAGRIPGGL